MLKAKDPTQASTENRGDLIRVGLSNNNFSKLDYSEISISAESTYDVIVDDKILYSGDSGIPSIIKLDKNIYSIKYADNSYSVEGRKKIIFTTRNNSYLYPIALKRNGKQAKYRGDFEISKTKNSGFNLINIIDINDYLKGVVPNELPVRFGFEALKAQAVAARNYVYRPRTRIYNSFDVCDSVQSQVYFGANTEQILSNQAVDETKNLFSLYEGEITLALYSSTAGGYTESYENAFSDIVNNKFPARPIPYLVGKPDYFSDKDLSNEENAREFYMNKTNSFDSESPYFRWTKKWTRKELEETLAKNLAKYSNTGFITPIYSLTNQFGELIDIKVLKRGKSGKIICVKITTTKGEWVVSKELVIRRVFENKDKSLPSANVIFQFWLDMQGKIDAIEAFGGGFGHGVGMSQYGAGFMAKNGCKFQEILQHYYSRISIGTLPSYEDLGKGESYEKDFYSPDGKGALVIQNTPSSLKKLYADINSSTIDLSNFVTRDEEVRIPLDNFLEQGLNKIKVYAPSQNTYSSNNLGIKTRLWVEVYKQTNEE
jgi:SpoIID/LytB domain protein